jgi:hypothetical protein
MFNANCFFYTAKEIGPEKKVYYNAQFRRADIFNKALFAFRPLGGTLTW